MHLLRSEPLARRPGRRDRESGSTAVEFVILTPVLMLILILLVQVAMYVFAEHVAATAAQAGDRAAREDLPSDPSGWKTSVNDAVTSWVGDLIGDGVDGPVTVTTGVVPKVASQCAPQTVTVTVQFEMISLFGGLKATGVSAGPVENFYLDC